MKLKVVIISFFVALSFSSCNLVNQQIGGYYFNKAKKIAHSNEVSEREIDKFYDYLMKALDYKNNIPESIELVDNVTQASLKAGYIKAYENELKFYKKYVEKNPQSWDVYLNIINIFSLKGDLYNLSTLKDDFDKRSQSNKNFKILSFLVSTNLLYWTQSYGELSLYNSYDETMDYLNRYCSYSRGIKEVIDLNNRLFFKDADPGLYYYFTSSVSDINAKMPSINRNCQILDKSTVTPDFAKLIKYTVEGNKYFAKKDYSNAIIYYKAALRVDDSFYPAKKNLIETEFQNQLSLSLMKKDKTKLVNFIYDSLDELDNVISSTESITQLPFSDSDKFISSVLSLKAAMMSVLIDDNISDSKKARIEKNINDLLNDAIKYDPQNKMAKELLNRLFQK